MAIVRYRSTPLGYRVRFRQIRLAMFGEDCLCVDEIGMMGLVEGLMVVGAELVGDLFLDVEK